MDKHGLDEIVDAISSLSVEKSWHNASVCLDGESGAIASDLKDSIQSGAQSLRDWLSHDEDNEIEDAVEEEVLAASSREHPTEDMLQQQEAAVDANYEEVTDGREKGKRRPPQLSEIVQVLGPMEEYLNSHAVDEAYGHFHAMKQALVFASTRRRRSLRQTTLKQY